MSRIFERDIEPTTPEKTTPTRRTAEQTTPKKRLFQPSTSSFKENVIDRLNIDCAKHGKGIIILQPQPSDMGYAGAFSEYVWKPEEVTNFLENGVLPHDEDTMDQKTRVRPFWLFELPGEPNDITHYDFELESAPNLAAAMGFCLFVKMQNSEKIAAEKPKVVVAKTDVLTFTWTKSGKGRFALKEGTNTSKDADVAMGADLEDLAELLRHY